MASKKLPPFSSLPLDKAGPPGNAWGLWGPDDELGMLNLLTAETTAAAAQEIREGLRIRLDWPLDKPSFPSFERQRFEHQVHHKAPMTMNDDSIHINTQSSTQWDGFRHYGYQRTKQFFMGHTQDDFKPGSTKLGIDAWAQKKAGIIGRGVLLDWYTWAQKNGIDRSPFSTGAVTIDELTAVAAENNITFRSGDILFIRVGFTARYSALTVAAQEAFPNREPGGLLGLEASRDSLSWLWNNEFAAIASDSPSFERGPATGPYNDPDVSLHQWCLAGWGLPLGEMFDLEELTRACRERNRWTFFLCSLPLRIPEGVASPGNAVAIM
ncbi:putative cyclase-domain-containing protein [Xylariales sp. PMI_506]|nr:putative cyclase-domain-containing protein [Xylariales sp. PMI_506]